MVSGPERPRIAEESACLSKLDLIDKQLQLLSAKADLFAEKLETIEDLPPLVVEESGAEAV